MKNKDFAYLMIVLLLLLLGMILEGNMQ